MSIKSHVFTRIKWKIVILQPPNLPTCVCVISFLSTWGRPSHIQDREHPWQTTAASFDVSSLAALDMKAVTTRPQTCRHHAHNAFVCLIFIDTFFVFLFCVSQPLLSQDIFYMRKISRYAHQTKKGHKKISNLCHIVVQFLEVSLYHVFSTIHI